jgi:hypothetical protein
LAQWRQYPAETAVRTWKLLPRSKFSGSRHCAKPLGRYLSGWGQYRALRILTKETIMKPTKNRVYCKDCGKSKMLFETEKKAETFMKFNSGEIEEESGYKPERCYFCTYCGGWHVTSRKEYLAIKSRTEKVLDLYEQGKQKTALAQAELTLIQTEKREELKESLEEIEKYISILEFSERNAICYMETLNKAFRELEKVKSIGVAFKGSGKRKEEVAKKLNTLQDEIKKQ